MPKPIRHLPVAAAYDAWSADYDAHDNPMVMAARYILLGAAPAARGQDCLEVGCGTGANLAILRAAGARSVAGIDLSPGMLARARARLPGLALHQGSAADPWPIAATSLDLVLFCLTLEHVAALAPAFREAHRVLRPGGLVLVIEIHPALAAAGVAAHFEAADAIVTMPSFPHRLADYRAAAAASGLAVEQLRDWRCADFRAPHPKMARRDPEAPFALEGRLRKAPPG
jgi:malonyl-CoA O-methyltransferase